MRKTFYMFIPFFLMGSYLIADRTLDQTEVSENPSIFTSTIESDLTNCDDDQTSIWVHCYHTADLDALVAFATNSGLENEYADVIYIGEQTWNASRISCPLAPGRVRILIY